MCIKPKDMTNISTTTTTIIATKFVKWDVSELETLQGSRVCQLREKVIAKKPLSREDKHQ